MAPSVSVMSSAAASSTLLRRRTSAHAICLRGKQRRASQEHRSHDGRGKAIKKWCSPLPLGRLSLHLRLLLHLLENRDERRDELGRDFLQSALFAPPSRAAHLQSPHPVDHTDHAVEPHVRIPLLVPPEGLCDGSRIGESGRLQDDVVEGSSLSYHLLDGSEAVVSSGAAQAAVREGEERGGGCAGGRLDRDGSG